MRVCGFGIGYSSLNYLRDFPVDQLKIDRSFVQNLPHEAKDANIARHIIDMVHEVGLTVVAEGGGDGGTERISCMNSAATRSRGSSSASR